MALRIALVEPPAWGLECPPYGIAVLKAYLQKADRQVKAIDANLRLYKAASRKLRREWSPDRHQFWMDPASVRNAFEGELAKPVAALVEEVLAAKPKVVGLSILYSTQQAGLFLAREIKRRDPGVVIVLGGPQADRRAEGEALARDPAVDFVVQGEGEETTAELLSILERGGDPAGCRGLLFSRDGALVDTGPRPLLASLSALPFADYSDFPMMSYLDGAIPVSLSRGCPNKCAFCYELQYWGRFRTRKAESLIQEIQFMLVTLPRVWWLWFHDSLINGHMGEMTRFAQGMIDRGLRVRWTAQAVIRKEMTRDVLRLLRKSGCFSLNYGLESASFATMLRMGKVLAKGADADAIIRDTAEAGIEPIVNFMFGFPGETEEDFQESLDFVERNKDYIAMVQPSPGFCDFYKGTLGYQHPESLGITLREGSAHWESVDGTNTYLTRMKRFERFLAHVHELGIRCSYPYKKVYLKNTIIGNYHYSYGRYAEAVPFLETALAKEPFSEETRARLEESRLKASGA